MSHYFRPKRTIPLLLFAILLNGGLRLLNVASSPTQSQLRLLALGVTFVQIAIGIAVLLLSIGALSSGKSLEDAWQPLVLVIIYAAVGWLSIRLTRGLVAQQQLAGYAAFVAENQFLIDAIEAYSAENQSPPTTLRALYPDHLHEPIAVPSDDGLSITYPYTSIHLGTIQSIGYDYVRHDNQKWQLKVSISLGSFQFDTFTYASDPTLTSDGIRINDWVATLSR